MARDRVRVEVMVEAIDRGTWPIEAIDEIILEKWDDELTASSLHLVK